MKKIGKCDLPLFAKIELKRRQGSLSLFAKQSGKSTAKTNTQANPDAAEPTDQTDPDTTEPDTTGVAE